uniref:PRKR-interacting protein 1 n=1 Tax=Glossina austeni TaxID=7395 RepID=A0A1A9VIP6_GLOAU
MSLIKNLIKETDTFSSKLQINKELENEKVGHVVKSALDLQRLKIEKLMQNPNKPVVIPEQRKEKDFMQSVPTFVRNVMGSSAGAGSGEFHVYRHLRRKEYARQKMIQAKSVKEQLDEEYQRKLQENRKEAEEKTAKKRAKRLKKNSKKCRLQKSQLPKDDRAVNGSEDCQ